MLEQRPKISIYMSYFNKTFVTILHPDLIEPTLEEFLNNF